MATQSHQRTEVEVEWTELGFKADVIDRYHSAYNGGDYITVTWRRDSGAGPTIHVETNSKGQTADYLIRDHGFMLTPTQPQGQNKVRVFKILD